LSESHDLIETELERLIQSAGREASKIIEKAEWQAKIIAKGLEIRNWMK